MMDIIDVDKEVIARYVNEFLKDGTLQNWPVIYRPKSGMILLGTYYHFTCVRGEAS